MRILKKILRGIFYFCVGVKASCNDFFAWYQSCDGLPRALRSKTALAVMALTVVAGGWGLSTTFTGADALAKRERPATTSSRSAVHREPVKTASSSMPEENLPETVPEPVSMPQVSSPSSAVRTVDAMAGATRFTPLSTQTLGTTLAARSKDYYATTVAGKTPAAGDLAGWKEINSDVVAWIQIPNTNINYPVVIGQYTDYYESRDIYKNPSRNGVLWFDSDTRFDKKGAITSTNAVIYGHNWTNCWRPTRVGDPNDVMLAQLAAYDNADFMAKSPNIKIKTLAGEDTYKIFAVFYTDLSFGYNYAEKKGDGMMKIINTAKEKSIHKLDVPVTDKDKILTLSTCTRVMGAGENQRFVVMAKKVENKKAADKKK